MKKSILILAMCLFSSMAFAQRIVVQSGKLEFLKGEKNIGIEFSYKNLRVGGLYEADYIEKRVTEKNQKEAGSGEAWLEQWNKDRQTRFEPKFSLLFNDNIERERFPIIERNGKYKMKVDVIHIEPGFNVGVMRKNSEVSLRIEITDSESGEKKAVILIEKSSANDFMGTDFDSAYRIQESYAKAGRELAKFFNKKVK